MTDQTESTEIIRNYTAARRFPQLIGKTPDGKRIVGGPYTMTQFAGGGIALFALYVTRGLWWPHLSLANAAVFVVLTVVGTVVGLGRIRPGGRSPISVATGLARASRRSTNPAATTGPSPTFKLPRRHGTEPRTIAAAAYIWPTPPALIPNRHR